MKIGIFHDNLISMGGSERVMVELATQLKADLIVSGFNEKLKEKTDIKCNVIDIGNFSKGFSNMISCNLESPLRFFFNKDKFNYDINIFSLLSSIFAAKPNNLNIWFCHTPNRILYDLRELRIKRANLIKKIFYKIYIKLLYKIDQKVVRENFNKIIVNSKNVQKRVKKYYDRDSIVIYPPINTKNFRFNKFGDFYLAVSRLIPEKRMDFIAKSFVKMPDKKLVIVGDGYEKKKILGIIKNSKNIQLFDNTDDKTLIDFYSNCLATIYMPIDEDFGLVPLEGMASGKCCIAVNEGGCKETVINGKTGFLIKADESELIKAVKDLDKKTAEKMKVNCIKQAKKFDIKECIKNWEKVCQEVIKKNEKKD